MGSSKTRRHPAILFVFLSQLLTFLPPELIRYEGPSRPILMNGIRLCVAHGKHNHSYPRMDYSLKFSAS
jgi:hypothetical protein